MAGINFNELPPNLQAKLQPYMTVGGAKTVEEAIARAKDAKAWSADDDAALNKLNGGANWGKTMDEFAFDSKKADLYKAELPGAEKERQYAQARKRQESSSSTSKKVGRVIGGAATVIGGALTAGALITSAPAWVPIAVAVGGIGLLTSCAPENRVDVVQNQSVTIPRTDYMPILKAIVERLDKIDNNNAERFKALVEELGKIIENQNLTREMLEIQLESICNRLKNMLQQIIDNQIEMQIDNNKNAADIMAALLQIINSKETAEEKLEDLVELLQQIKSVGENIQSVSENILDEIKNAKEEIKQTLNTNNQLVLNGLDKLDKNDQKSLKVLNEIKELISKYGSEGNALAEAILTAIGRISGGDVDLSTIEDLLDKLVNGQKVTQSGIYNMTEILNNFSATNKAQLDVIISRLDKLNDAIEKLGSGIRVDLSAILNKIKPGGDTGKDYTAVLDAILKKLDGIKADNNNNFASVIKAIGQIDIKPQDLSWIKEHLNAILEAIKDHDVIVKVEGGKCCCCNQDGQPVHEGILGDLNDLLG